MLTLKLITEQYDRVIAGLNKKHFKGAKEAIDAVIAKDKERKSTQKQLDDNLAEANKLAKTIGMLMKNGQKEEAEAAKAKVAELKATNKELDDKKVAIEQEMTTMLCQIPNIPYDEVPEGSCAEDNWVVKSNLKERVVRSGTALCTLLQQTVIRPDACDDISGSCCKHYHQRTDIRYRHSEEQENNAFRIPYSGG